MNLSLLSRSTGRVCICSLAVLMCVSAAQTLSPPETKKIPVVDQIHGVRIADPYRWLENQESSETRKWLEAQNAYAEAVVGSSELRSEVRSRLSQLMRYDEASPVKKGGDWEYFTLVRSKSELPVICRRPAPPKDKLPPIDPQTDCEVVVDPHPMSADHTTKVELLSVSADGKLIAYGIRDGGQDELEIRIRDVNARRDLPDRFPNALYDNIAFNKKGNGLYYSFRSRQTGPRIRFHSLGTKMESDLVLFGENCDPTKFLDFQELDDGKYLLITVDHGWVRTELHVKNLKENGPVRPIVTDAEARFYSSFDSGKLFVRTNLDAPRNRLLAIDLQHPEREHWKEILPETSDVLHDLTILDGKIYATYLHNVSSRIKVFDRDGSPMGEIAIPEYNSAELKGAGKGKILLTLQSFHQPPVTYLIDSAENTRTVWQSRNLPFDGRNIVIHQEWCTSRDGTKVPFYVVHRKDVALDGNRPTLLHGYGGFYVALTPTWDPAAALWIEHGGIFAMANLRGGSEFGENWHRAGMLQNKQNVFDDFLTTAEWLIAKGHTNPKQLAIRGISNGGLLVASALTQRPNLFRAVLCEFPDLDMIRFNTFTQTNNIPALLEYGNAAVPEQFEFLRRYSPYQAVKEGTAYPAVMITSGDLDTRVPPLQARKFAARLQAASSSGLPVILRYHSKAGHATDHGLPVSMRIEDTAMELTFLFQMLGENTTTETQRH